MLNISHLRTLIIRPTLQYMEMWSEVAENLVVGTAIQESHATYLKQLGNGPALGLFQMEGVTHDDLWKNYIRYRAPIMNKLYNISIANNTKDTFINEVSAKEMIGNLYYATAMCRIQYLRAPEKLPSNTIRGLAYYWKKYYNTHLGAGTEEEFIHNYQTYNQN